VFLKLMTSIKQFRGESEFSTWLYRMVVNTCMDGARKRRDVTTDLARVAGTSSPEEDLARSERIGKVQSALSSLPPKLRLPILLRYFEDFSYLQMAKALNCSAGTVASRLHKGHRLLAEKLSRI
jgi:RNA polymerase sigma-70 factor (ECF subfamily)